MKENTHNNEQHSACSSCTSASAGCTNSSCSGCSGAATQQKAAAQHNMLIEKPHPKSSIKKVIAVVSGKGGVGKSLITALLACSAQKKGVRTAVLDADITGPSIPKIFGLHAKAQGDESGIYPVISTDGIQVMSINFLLENETDPVLWRGPIIAGAVKQFWTDVIWQNVDLMFIDMPPGTGDVPLTVFQSLGIDGIILVASPQELVGMIVEKAVKMADTMHIPVLAIVENMSYIQCPDCGKKIKVFGESNSETLALKHKIPLTIKLPIDPEFAASCDTGCIEKLNRTEFDDLIESLKV